MPYFRHQGSQYDYGPKGIRVTRVVFLIFVEKTLASMDVDVMNSIIIPRSAHHRQDGCCTALLLVEFFAFVVICILASIPAG